MSKQNAQQQAEQLRREECRRLVLGYLAARQTLAFRIEAIVRGLQREEAADYDSDEVSSALIFLEQFTPSMVKRERAALGATLSFQATSAGVLAWERREF